MVNVSFKAKKSTYIEMNWKGIFLIQASIPKN